LLLIIRQSKNDVIRLAFLMVPCFSLKPNWCVGSLLFILGCGLIPGSSIFFFQSWQVSKLIGLYYCACVLSFPGFGIITMVDFIHFWVKYPSLAIVLNNKQICRIACFGSLTSRLKSKEPIDVFTSSYLDL